MFWIFLTGGLFLGWSLGANDTANIFGSAVGSRMLSFRKAAIICSLFVIAGAIFQGGGTTETLNSLGATEEFKHAFIITLSAGITVFVFSLLALPVSTSQAIVGAIIGWNLFAGLPTDFDVIKKIFLSWILCPILAAVFSVTLFLLINIFIRRSGINIFMHDALIRWGLIVVGAFGAYSLGANNIANITGVFIPAATLNNINAGIPVSIDIQLFFLGAIAISLGVFTFSHRTIKTIGTKIFKITPEMAFIVVLAHSLVLFIFSSSKLSTLAVSLGLFPIPLVPVSSSHAIVGAIIGLGLLKGGYGINYKVTGEIAAGWIITPLLSGILTFSIFWVVNFFKV